MHGLNQVCRRRRTERLLLHLHEVTRRVEASFINTKRLDISLLHFFNDDAIVFCCFFVAIPHHTCQLQYHDNSPMSKTSWLGRSVPYISMICWYASLSSSTLQITVIIKNKRLEVECGSLVYLNSSLLINLSMKRTTHTHPHSIFQEYQFQYCFC